MEAGNGLVQSVPLNANWKNGRGLFLQDRENIEAAYILSSLVKLEEEGVNLLALRTETWRNPEPSQSAGWAIPIGMIFEDIAVLHTFHFLCLTPSPEVKSCAWAAEVKLTVRLLRKHTELIWHGKELPLCDNLTLTLGWLWHWIHFWSQLITWNREEFR